MPESAPWTSTPTASCAGRPRASPAARPKSTTSCRTRSWPRCRPGAATCAWLAGVMQNQAAMHVRSDGPASTARTRCRQRRHGTRGAAADRAMPAACCARLPPAARRVATLALHGLVRGRDPLDPGGIAGRVPPAPDQHPQGARRRCRPSCNPRRWRSPTCAIPARSVDLQFGLVRRALKAALGGRPGLATHDADGHLLVIRSDAHTRPLRGNS